MRTLRPAFKTFYGLHRRSPLPAKELYWTTKLKFFPLLSHNIQAAVL
jgi:hypothetical protein